MIAFDNGPANGDYVRYIDDLMKSAATAAAAAVASPAAMLQPSGRVGPLDEARARLAALRAAAGPAASSTGFAQPVSATPTAAAAAAIASALMSGQVGGGRALASHLKVALGAIAAGVVLIFVGLLWTPLNLLVVGFGISAIVWAIRSLRDARTRT